MKEFGQKILNNIRYILAFLVVLYIGLIIGYSVIGDGSLLDAITLSNVKHLLELIIN